MGDADILVDNGNHKAAEEGLVTEQYKDINNSDGNMTLKTKTRFLKLPLDPANPGPSNFLSTSNSD